MLTVAGFPKLKISIRARWAPIFLAPILHSPERLVIAVAVVGDAGFHIERANQLGRLSCLYGRAANTAIFAAEVALDELMTSLSERGADVLSTGALVFSGIYIGDIEEGEAQSLQEIAQIWMAALSSLYKYTAPVLEERPDQATSLEQTAENTDRLPTLVLDHVSSVNPALAKNFSEDIKNYRRRRASTGIAGISIDYSGSRLVANFATLLPSAPAQTVDRIKRKMFDLKVRQDKDGGLFGARDHEMILFSPILADHQYSERLSEVLGSLQEQSSNEGFGFSVHKEIPHIGARVLALEINSTTLN